MCGTHPDAAWVRLPEAWSEAHCDLDTPTYLMVRAKRLRLEPIFRRYPQQSLNQMHWAEPSEAPELRGRAKDWQV